jgi:hypothetical protein
MRAQGSRDRRALSHHRELLARSHPTLRRRVRGVSKLHPTTLTRILRRVVILQQLAIVFTRRPITIASEQQKEIISSRSGWHLTDKCSYNGADDSDAVLRGAAMRNFGAISVVACNFLVAGCSSVPPLSDATGDFESKILIREIVRRVKCEISDAFDAKIERADFKWLENWTAKVDLILQVNEQAGVAPSVAYTKFYKNAFNFDAGSTSLTSNVIGSAQQFLTLTAGANLSEQAQRSETVTFTLSLKEIKTWRKYLRNAERYGRSVGDPICDRTGRELRGNLGLTEWIDSALYPVEKSELQAGYHPPPGSGASKPPSVSPKGVAPKEFGLLPFEGVTPDEAIKEIAPFLTAAEKSATDAANSQSKVATSASHVQTHMQTTIGPYFNVLTDDLKASISSNLSAIATILKYATDDADSAAVEARKIHAFIDDLAARPSNTRVDSRQMKADAEQFARNAKTFADHAKNQMAAAQKIEAAITGFIPNPPIDGLLHSVQFIVTNGASITPNWTLLQWKGPGITVPGASVSGVRTNTLNIALGPTTEQNRLIQNQTVINSAPRAQ